MATEYFSNRSYITIDKFLVYHMAWPVLTNEMLHTSRLQYSSRPSLQKNASNDSCLEEFCV